MIHGSTHPAVPPARHPHLPLHHRHQPAPPLPLPRRRQPCSRPAPPRPRSTCASPVQGPASSSRPSSQQRVRGTLWVSSLGFVYVVAQLSGHRAENLPASSCSSIGTRASAGPKSSSVTALSTSPAVMLLPERSSAWSCACAAGCQLDSLDKGAVRTQEVDEERRGPQESGHHVLLHLDIIRDLGVSYQIEIHEADFHACCIVALLMS